MDSAVITMILLILLALYGLYVFIQAWSILTTGLVDLSVKQTIPASSISSPASINFYYSAWLYINANSNGSILVREIEVYIDRPSTLNLIVSRNTLTITEHFPTNRWVFFVLNVINGQFVEVYLNGKLVKSIQLSSQMSTPDQTKALTVGNVHGKTLSGYMTKLIRNPSNIDAATVWATYLQGNGKYSGTMFGILDYLDSLGIKIDLSRNGSLQREITLGNVIPTTTS